MCERVKRKRTKNVAAKSKKSYDFELMMISHFGCVRFVLSFTRLECVCVPLLLRNVWLSPNRMLRDTFLIHCDYFSQVSVCVCVYVCVSFFPSLSICISSAHVPAIHHFSLHGMLPYIYVCKNLFYSRLFAETNCVCVCVFCLFHTLLFFPQYQSFRWRGWSWLSTDSLLQSEKNACITNATSTHTYRMRFER